MSRTVNLLLAAAAAALVIAWTVTPASAQPENKPDKPEAGADQPDQPETAQPTENEEEKAEGEQGEAEEEQGEAEEGEQEGEAEEEEETAPPPRRPPPPTEAPAPTNPALPPGKGGLRLHFVSTESTYVAQHYDVFSVATRQIAGSGVGAVESVGQTPKLLILDPGLYKIVRAGEPYGTQTDFVTATVEEGYVTDFVVIVDEQTGNFRGGGPVTDELPEGVKIAGVRLALNGGGSILLNQKVNPVGNTSGTTAIVGLFGNFGLVFDRGNHFLDVSSELQLNFTDNPTGKAFSTTDIFKGNATYTYKINNPYIGPYARAAFRTRVFPGYLYTSNDGPSTTLDIQRKDGSMQTVTLGTQANPDDLRFKLSKPLSPFVIQEEVGANLKAVDLDLLLVKLVVGTRLGFGFRQGINKDLFVVAGDDDGPLINLVEVDNYNTLGPVAGATAKVTVARWLFGQAEFGLMAPLMNTDDEIDLTGGDKLGFGSRLLMEFSGTAGFKVPILTNLLYASFDYTFRLDRDGFITNETQFEHTLMGRANITLF